MREIKFRAWLKSCKRMIDEITIYPDWKMVGLSDDSFEDQIGNCEEGYEFDGEYVVTTDGEFTRVLSPLIGEEWIFIEEKDYILMQFTGLKDKNGKEIYEGDIVKFGTEDKSVVTYREKRHVTYGHGDSGEDFIVGFHIGSSYGQGNQPEVIGNIHENPELL